MKLQESERTEFKSIVVTDIKKEIIAFANCDGGKIYIGIEDDGTVIGVEDSDSVALQVSNMVRDGLCYVWKALVAWCMVTGWRLRSCSVCVIKTFL